MRKPIEDEIHDIISRQMAQKIDAEMTAIFSADALLGTAKQVPLNVKDIEHMLAEIDALPKLPDLQYVFVAKDGKTIQVERVINLLTATEEDVKNVFRNHPELGIDLTGAEVVSFERPKLNWQQPMFSMSVWEPEETEDTEEDNAETT